MPPVGNIGLGLVFLFTLTNSVLISVHRLFTFKVIIDLIRLIPTMFVTVSFYSFHLFFLSFFLFLLSHQAFHMAPFYTFPLCLLKFLLAALKLTIYILQSKFHL